MKKSCLYVLVLMMVTTYATAQPGKIYPHEHSSSNRIEIRMFSYDGSTIVLELDRFSQLDSFENVTTLLPAIWKEIAPAVNTMQDTYTTKRLQYLMGSKSAQIYVKEYPSEFKGYQLKDQSLQQLKSGYDTLRITKIVHEKSKKKGWDIQRPIHLSIILPHLSGLNNYHATAIDSAFQKIKSETNNKTVLLKPTFLTYDQQTQEWNFPSGFKAGAKSRNTHIEPDIHVGIQYVRGEWVPFAAAGIQLIKGDYFGKRSVFQLMWEPHFLFGTYASGNIRAHRNDFITFRYHEHYKSTKNKRENVMRFSVGYLINRSGDLYREHTIKFSLPGVNFKTLYLEPEFFFHDFFKHFSPSLKLSLNID